MGLLRKKPLNGDGKVGVCGTGYIGFSTMANFAVNGVACLGTDVVQSGSRHYQPRESADPESGILARLPRGASGKIRVRSYIHLQPPR